MEKVLRPELYCSERVLRASSSVAEDWWVKEGRISRGGIPTMMKSIPFAVLVPRKLTVVKKFLRIAHLLTGPLE